ncbi:adipocyte plasma membrane-associated protein-like [Lytechinus variegatus]|uniref:adipocyte plasma membrane-associated protein-like n=1 Tax=Lytechinus variegatus TaxID=7654 RepID=UPI001BB29120|nr:adipocyte plasma membrane-associated protein-like [Lytechinus variegatus]XP_041469520.1 adipocyte plasma membrane-associated protein-like [Lytechinus variegatus]
MMANTEGIRHRKPELIEDDGQNEPPKQRKRKLKKQGMMTRCCNLFSGVFKITFVIVLALTILITLKSSPAEPEAFELPPPRPWTGALAPNNKLQKAQKLLEGKIIGPESLAYNKGRIYTGTYDGKVVEIKNDKDIKVIAQLGTPPCGTREDEMKCGRPLGIKFIGDKLYMIDAYYGLFEIDHKGNSLPVELVSTQRSYKGHRMKFANDFVKLDNGDFLFTDSSYRKYRKDYGILALESKGCGRLLWFNPVNRMSDLSLDELHFPNGLQLSPKEDFLLIAETSRYRILKYHLTGPMTGSTEVFIDNLPGMPDNIRPSRNGGYWVGFAFASSRRGLLTADLLAPYPWIRRLIAKVIDPTQIVNLMPQYGLIIELNQEGEIVQSLHDPTGKIVPSVSEVLDTGKALYLGSYHAPYLLKLDM